MERVKFRKRYAHVDCTIGNGKYIGTGFDQKRGELRAQIIVRNLAACRRKIYVVRTIGTTCISRTE
jgi:hypothetical protein